MKTIHKYPLPVQDVPTTLALPAGSVVRHAGAQEDQICLWIEMNTDLTFLPTAYRRFIVAGTGHYISDSWVYVGTVQLPPYVWHVYEVL